MADLVTELQGFKHLFGIGKYGQAANRADVEEQNARENDARLRAALAQHLHEHYGIHPEQIPGIQSGRLGEFNLGVRAPAEVGSINAGTRLTGEQASTVGATRDTLLPAQVAGTQANTNLTGEQTKTLADERTKTAPIRRAGMEAGNALTWQQVMGLQDEHSLLPERRAGMEATTGLTTEETASRKANRETMLPAQVEGVQANTAATKQSTAGAKYNQDYLQRVNEASALLGIPIEAILNMQRAVQGSQAIESGATANKRGALQLTGEQEAHDVFNNPAVAGKMHDLYGVTPTNPAEAGAVETMGRTSALQDQHSAEVLGHLATYLPPGPESQAILGRLHELLHVKPAANPGGDAAKAVMDLIQRDRAAKAVGKGGTNTTATEAPSSGTSVGGIVHGAVSTGLDIRKILDLLSRGKNIVNRLAPDEIQPQQ